MPGSSIHSYFSSPSKSGDGFTAEERHSALQSSNAPASAQWTPTIDYEEADIGSLEPGPRNLTLMGRIVNFYDVAKPSKQHRAAQGYLKIQLADDTGILTVRLWYNNNMYSIRLGQLVTLWTVHVSNSSEHNSLAPSTAPLFTSIFPEGERNCHFMLHENSDNGMQFKRPFSCRDTKELPGLMTLRSFTDGGYDIDEPRLLVCIKSIGARKKYINRNGTTSDSVSLGIFDDTADATLTLYSRLADSASSFQPSHTVLLISCPGWRIERTAKLTLNANSRIDIDPDLADARRLRMLAQRLTRKEHVNPPFPADVDVKSFPDAQIRALWTLAEVDEFSRSNPREKAVGYISVILTQLDVVTPYKRNMLMCNECCGMAMYANQIEEVCRGCEKRVGLRINPRILGPIIDETGQIASGKLILTDAAWEQLLGRSPAQLVSTPLETLRYLEQRLLMLRVTVGFALSLEDGLGRLGVWYIGN